MCCSLWFLSLRLVLEYFSTVLPNFYLWKQGLSDVLLFVIPSLCLVLEYFQQSYPIYLWSRDWWCAALLWFLSLCLVLRVFFNSPTISTYESRDWVMCCSLWFLSLRLVLRVFFNSPTQFLPMAEVSVCCSFVIPFLCLVLGIFQQSYPFLPMKQGLSDVLLFCDFLCVWS
jgi:hypothetical protein